MVTKRREKKKPLYWWWQCKLVKPLMKTLRRYWKEFKNGTSIWSSNHTSIHIQPNEMKNRISKSYVHPMYMIAKTQKQYLSITWWIKMAHTHTHTRMRACTQTHRKIIRPQERRKSLPFLTTQMNTAGITLSEISQTEKQCMILLNADSKKKQKAQTVEWWSPGCGSGWTQKMLVKGRKVPFTKWVSSGDLMFSMLTKVNNILYI